MAGTPRLQVRHLSKTFGPARVLQDVDLTVQAGEVHGLAGQNGSGKSTLIKILTGFHAADPGAEYQVDGALMRQPVRWKEVHAAGVSVVHQDLGLLDHLTVAENVCVGGFPTSRLLGRIDRRRRDEVASSTLARLGVHVHPGALVGSLTAPERAEVAIARAMRDQTAGAGLVILDESTRALTGGDLIRIHDTLRRIAASGSSVVLISHNLPELLAVTDRLTILRDGRVAGLALTTSELNEAEVSRVMLGAAVANASPRSSGPTPAARAAAVAVVGMTGSRLRSVSFEVGRSEIVGITGLPGSGYEDIPYLLTGAQPATAGRLDIGAAGLDLRNVTVASCIRLGAVLVPERRDRDGLAFELPVRDNISLPGLRGRGRKWFVGRRWQQAEAEQASHTLGIRPRDPLLLVRQLSGGNQQKVLLAKWLTLRPTLLVLHEPTQAVDVGARQDILVALQRAADAGMSVLLVSSEPEDLAAACDRVLVYGTDGLVDATKLTPDAILEHIYGAPTVTDDAKAGIPA